MQCLCAVRQLHCYRWINCDVSVGGTGCINCMKKVPKDSKHLTAGEHTPNGEVVHSGQDFEAQVPRPCV